MGMFAAYTVGDIISISNIITDIESETVID